ncbi:MAG: signal transduction histidine kinase [Oleispira sp.]|jgi:signal transduction histidine kinase
MFNTLRNKIVFAMISYTVFIAVFSAAIFYQGLYVSENTYLNSIVNSHFDYISQRSLPKTIPYKIDINSTLFLLASKELPNYITETDPGLYEIREEEIHYRIGKHPDGSMIVILLNDMLKILDRQEGRLETLLISIVLITIIVGSIVVSYLVTLLMRRLTELSNDVKTAISHNLIIPKAIPISHLRGNKDEVDMLREAFSQYSQQLLDHAEREKYFTQHASHELRTPVAIIRNCFHILMKTDLNTQQYNNVLRIGKAAEKAKKLTDCFLLLARHHSKDLEVINIENILLEVIESQKKLLLANDFKLEIDSMPVSISCHSAMFDILCANLLGNAIKYGQKTITVLLTEEALIISNFSESQPKDQGFGLVICLRICDYLNWKITHQYEKNKFIACIDFSPHQLSINVDE